MKKLLSLLLALMLLFSALPVAATTEDGLITVYVTASKQGEFLQTAQEELTVLLPVTLEGEDSYDLNDVFSTFHNQYAPEECAYICEETPQWGLGITQFWGDTSGNYGYWLNSAMAWSLSDTVADGDFVDVTIYESSSYFESFATFDDVTAEAQTNETISLTLSQAGFDDTWNEVLAPCEGATITINSEETGVTTDENGYVELSFDEPGTYLVSAQKETTVGDNTYTAITPPYCIITVAEPQSLTVMHNIAQKYSNETITEDGNLIWFLCDLAMYQEVYPEYVAPLSEEVQQACVDIIVADVKDSISASQMAKSILALRAMGYDPKNITASNGETFNLVERLTAKIDENSSDIQNVYALPYILLALKQGENYATDEQLNILLDIVINKKDEWQNDMWGVDAMAAMLMALPYFTLNEEISALMSESVTLVTESQSENGTIGNAASTGLAIAGLCAAGADISAICQNGPTPVDGLLTYKTETGDGFLPDTNSFSTEQGFRGLVAWQYKTTFPEKYVYDFSACAENPAVATPDETAQPETTPEPTESPEPSATPTPTPAPHHGGGGGFYPKPTPTSTPTPKDLEKEAVISRRNAAVKVPQVGDAKTFSDISTHKNRTQIEELAKRGIINGKSADTYCPQDTMTRAEFAALITRALGLTSSQETPFTDISTQDWYFTSVNTAYHFGIIKGISHTEFHPNGTVSRQEAAVMLSRAALLCGLEFTMDEVATEQTLSAFFDHQSSASWAINELAFCYQNGILAAEGSLIHPEESIDRGEIASVLYQLLEKSYLLEGDTSEK